MSDPVSDSALLIITLAGLSVLVVIVAFMFGRNRKRLDSVTAELADLKHDLSIFNDGAQGIGRRLVEAEKQLKMVANDQAQLKQQTSNQSFTDAAVLVAEGLTVDQIVERCEISRAEVELMVLLRDAD